MPFTQGPFPCFTRDSVCRAAKLPVVLSLKLNFQLRIAPALGAHAIQASGEASLGRKRVKVHLESGDFIKEPYKPISTFCAEARPLCLPCPTTISRALQRTRMPIAVEDTRL